MTFRTCDTKDIKTVLTVCAQIIITVKHPLYPLAESTMTFKTLHFN